MSIRAAEQQERHRRQRLPKHSPDHLLPTRREKWSSIWERWLPTILRDLIFAGLVGLVVGGVLAGTQFVAEQGREERRFEQAHQLEDERQQASEQRAALTALLPGLIREARQLLEAVTGEWRQQVTRLLATAEVVQAYVLIKQDRPIDAQAVAADAMALADAADDPVLVGSALRCLGETYMRHATYDLASDLALEGAAHVDRCSTVTLESLAVEGAGFLTAATASARGGDRPAAAELLDAADRCAERMGQDVVGSVVFGPTNVAIHRVALEVELGDPKAALRHAVGFNIAHRAGMDERQARYLLDVARAEVATDQAGQAVETLLYAESISPEEIRTHRLTKGIVIDLIAAGHGSKGPVQQLAARSGVSY